MNDNDPAEDTRRGNARKHALIGVLLTLLVIVAAWAGLNPDDLGALGHLAADVVRLLGG